MYEFSIEGQRARTDVIAFADQIRKDDDGGLCVWM
jgi:hypothetical protein